MSSPRRYRMALRACPAAYRRDRGLELLATLADGDDHRGRPSTREAIALAGYGLALRARAAASPEGLLAIAAALVIVPLVGAAGWAQHMFVADRGVSASFVVGAPGLLLQTALATVAFVALAAGPGKALERPGRRRACMPLGAAVALVVFAAPARTFHAGVPDGALVAESLRWLSTAPVDHWELAVPAVLLALLGTSLALPLLGRMTAPQRQRTLAVAFVALAGAVVADAWQRPDIAVPYAQSAFEDLQLGTFMVVLGLLLALASLVRQPPRSVVPRAAGR
jgi:hypothetical protein